MNVNRFARKYDMNLKSVYSCVSRYPQFKIDYKYRYDLLDKEMDKRTALKELLQDELVESTGKDIKECFDDTRHPNASACDWIGTLYRLPPETRCSFVGNKQFSKMEIVKAYLDGKRCK